MTSHQFIDRSLYTATIEGKIDYLLGVKDCLEDAVTPNKNTVLHIAALFGQAQSVKVIVKTCPSLLNRVNFKGETPLHVASREGHSEVVRALVECAKALVECAKALVECAKALDDELESGFGAATKNMLRLTSDNGDTALHKAVRYRRVDVVKLLVGEDPNFSHLPNKASETPLYLAAEKGLDDCTKVILNTCPSPSYSGPGGRTALHAAVIFDSEGSTTELLKWNLDLVNVADQNGWTPFHFAASRGHIKRARQLLDSHQSIAYVTTENDEKETALHIAAGRGHLNIIKDIIAEYPTCLEMVNGKGQNMLHVAVENTHGEHEVLKFILQSHMLTSSLINQKDFEGNTPLHLLAASGHYSSDLVRHPKAETIVFNSKNLTPLDTVYDSGTIFLDWERFGGVPYLRGEFIERGDQINTMNPASPTLVSECITPLAVAAAAEEDKMHNNTIRVVAPPTLVSQHTTDISAFSSRVAHAAQRNIEKTSSGSELVVIALIVTVTFAAGFTMPGGYIGNDGPNEGMAALTRVAAFRAFVISDALAFFLSCIALFIHYGELGDEGEAGDGSEMDGFAFTSFAFTTLAIFAMMVAFTTGTYGVLVHSLGLPIAITVFFGCSVVICVIIYYNAVK